MTTVDEAMARDVAAANAPEIITPEQRPPATLGGLALTHDNIGARAREISLPTVTGRETSWALIPHAATLAGMVANTDFVPPALRGNAPAVAALMLLGHELGLGPMASMQGLTVTPSKVLDNGKRVGGDIITLAKTMRGIVRSHGHRMWPDPDEYTAIRVRWHGYRIDDPTHVMSVLYTIEDAKAAGLLNMPNGKPGAWQKTPRRMLSARASSELAILLDEDGLLGISMVAEEVDDNGETADLLEAAATSPDAAAAADVDADVDTSTVAAESTATKPRSTRRRAAAAATPPPQPTADLAVPGDEPGTPLIDAGDSEAQSSAPSPETHAIAQAPAAAPPDTPPSASPSLEVPGDQREPGEPAPGAQQTIPGVAYRKAESGGYDKVEPETPADLDDLDAAAATPTVPSVQRAATETTQREGMSADQKIAMLCREAGVDRAALVRILTDKRSESAKDLTPTMQAFAIEHLRAVARGEETFHDNLIPPFTVVGTVMLAERARVQLAKLTDTGRLRPTLAALGWVEANDGKVSDWLAKRDRQELLEVISAARAAQAAVDPPA